MKPTLYFIALLNFFIQVNSDVVLGHYDAKNEDTIEDIFQNLDSNEEYFRNTPYYKGRPRDCHEVQAAERRLTSGLYTIFPPRLNRSIPVYCDMDTDDGGWLVIQRRMKNSETFFRNWEEYKIGFGDLSTDFWLGNENIHDITAQRLYELRVDLCDFEDNDVYAKYKGFYVAPEVIKYKLFVGDYSGDAGDSLSYHNMQVFSTKDKSINGCPLRNHGAWWYKDCHRSNLNGYYFFGRYSEPFASGITWYDWKHTYDYSMKRTEMKIRPVNYRYYGNAFP